MNNDYMQQREEILGEIERDQEEVRAAVQELTRAARETFSLTDHIREHPMVWLAGGFLVGLWLGHRSRPARVILADDGEF